MQAARHGEGELLQPEARASLDGERAPPPHAVLPRDVGVPAVRHVHRRQEKRALHLRVLKPRGVRM